MARAGPGVTPHGEGGAGSDATWRGRGREGRHMARAEPGVTPHGEGGARSDATW